MTYSSDFSIFLPIDLCAEHFLIACLAMELELMISPFFRLLFFLIYLLLDKGSETVLEKV